MAPKMDEGMRLAERCNALIRRLEQRGFTVQRYFSGENWEGVWHQVGPRMLSLTLSRYTDAQVQRWTYQRLMAWLEDVLRTDSMTGPEATLEHINGMDFTRTPTRQERPPLVVDRGMRL